MIPPSELAFADASRVALDERLAGIVQAANEVAAGQGRLRALLRMTQEITAQLDLDPLLHHVVEGACRLTGAERAALAVVDEHGGLAELIQVGLDAAELDRISRLPRGPGLLAAMVRDPRPVRIADVRADPRTAAFADGHPGPHDLLAVPVSVRASVYGFLMVSGAPSGAFRDEDEQLLRALATTAGFAVDNARLYRSMLLSEAWATASVEITALLVGGEEREALSLITARTQELTGATSSFLLLLGEDDPDQVEVVEVCGEDPHHVRGRTYPLAGTLAEPAIRTGEPQQLSEEDLQALERADLDPFGRVLILPLRTTEGTTGALVISRPPGAALFTTEELTAATRFAGRAAVVMKLLRAREQARRVLLAEDRERIARDLQDRVIQQLFATGMQLQVGLGTLPPGRSADRVDAAIVSLDDVINRIRQIIFTEHTAAHAVPRLSTRARLLELMEQQSAAFAIDPTVTVKGPVDSAVDGDLAEDVLAVVSEGIANAVKHGTSSDIAVTVGVDGRGVSVTVSNDGAPLASTGRRSGLRNLEDRAGRRGGTTSLASVDGRAVLTWTVPLPAA